MKRMMVWIACGVIAAGAARADFSDNFNDNARNTAAWKSLPRAGSFLEMNKRLYFRDNRTTGSADYLNALWVNKASYPVAQGQKLEMSILVNIPKLYMTSTSQAYSIGFGFQNGIASATKEVTVSVSDRITDFDGIISFSGADADSGYVPMGIPTPLSRFYLVARYNGSTGSLNVWQQALDGSWSTLMGRVNLRTVWHMPAGATLNLTPYLIAGSSSIPVSEASFLYLDNFSVRYVLP
jgi:hypothetical protein